MKATIPYVEHKFEEFNRQMFGGKLPHTPIELSHAKTFLGQCVCKKRRSLFGRTELYDFRLRINARPDLEEHKLEDVIIHEMIHLYIGIHQLEDTSAHGALFRKMMDDINKRFGRHVTVSHKSTETSREQMADTRRRWHVVAVVGFHDGRTGIKVLPRIVQRICHYYSSVLSSREVQGVKLYMSNDTFFNRFPNSSALKVHFMDPSVLSEHLTGAERMECDGQTIKRHISS